MFKSLVKNAFRNITLKFGYSFLNILGMTLGITSALFLILYVSDELSFDRYHEHGDRIYRVQSHITEPDDEFTWIVAQIPFAPQVKEDYPEVESATRLFNFNRSLFINGDIEFTEEDVYYADSTFFDVFTYHTIEGSTEESLDVPNSIVLTETMASRYFGGDKAVGNTLKVGEEIFTVTAVIEDVPRNSHVLFDGLVSRNSLPEQMGSWGGFGVYTYLLLQEGEDATELQEKMKEMYERYMATIFESIGITIEYELMKVTDIHLHSDNASEPQPTGSIQYVIIFSIVAFFLLLIATLNYINLATARSAKRAKEISLRKVIGSSRRLLITQFLAESSLLTFFSLVLSIGLIMILLPQLNMLSGKDFSLEILGRPIAILSLIGIMFVVGILGGTYPAIFLSRFSPVMVMKGVTQSGTSRGIFRKVLTVIQFTISGVMIASTLVVINQLDYMQNKDQGWTMEGVIGLQLPDNEPMANMRLLKEKLLENPQIEHVALTNTSVGNGSSKTIFDMETSNGMESRGVNFAFVDHDFTETLGIQIVEGRDFSLDFIGDTLTGVVVNETLAERLNWDEPIGKRVQLGDGGIIMARVIGVMKDYHQTGMYNEVESLMLLYRLNNPLMYVKLAGEDDEVTLAFIGEKWGEIFAGKPFDYSFLQDDFMEQFANDRNRRAVFAGFTILVIVIACLGLFGLASYTTERRTKEVGIRKVFGASVARILKIISWEFLVLILISLALSIPAVWFLMSNWLQNYVYRYEMGPLIFLWTILLILLPTALTVSYQSYKAATANPADSMTVE
ncbi:MAG: FtsX-like permease family protein [Bacteroidia bacterium]|nr:MAG: FtsX-like permease family protein [Bacteroidia bacterium]